MSPLYGFSADDAARLRAGDKKVSLYASLTKAAAGEDPRCQRVLRDLAQLRDLAATLPSDTFLTQLYGRTGYPDMVLAMEDGEARLANFRLLQRYAKEYEAPATTASPASCGFSSACARTTPTCRPLRSSPRRETRWP